MAAEKTNLVVAVSGKDDVPHCDTNVGDETFIMLDIFYPIREEFAKKVCSSDR